MYNFRRSTLVQISYCDQISNFEKRLSKHYENIDTIPDTDIQQMIIELDVVSQRCPTMSQVLIKIKNVYKLTNVCI